MKCRRCSTQISCRNRSTTAMDKHLASHARHDFLILRRPSGESIERKEWVTSTLTTVLNTPYRNLSHPVYRFLYRGCGLGDICRKRARRNTDEVYEQVRESVTEELRELKRRGAILSLTADEWSWHRKRFIGVTVCSSREIPSVKSRFLDVLARFRMQGTASNLLEALRDILKTFDLNFNDIRGFTSDAASQMVRVAELIAEERTAGGAFYHQKCLIHGIHLAMMATLNEKVRTTKRKDRKGEQPHGARSEGSRIPEDIPEEEEPPEVPDVQQEIEISDCGHWILIGKIRSLCREFTQSCSKSDRLDFTSGQLAGCKPLRVVSDVAIRWNSTLGMLERFLQLEQPIRIYCEERGETFPLTRKEVSSISSLLPALRVVEEVTCRLSKEGTTLYDSEVILEVIMHPSAWLDSRNFLCKRADSYFEYGFHSSTSSRVSKRVSRSTRSSEACLRI